MNQIDAVMIAVQYGAEHGKISIEEIQQQIKDAELESADAIPFLRKAAEDFLFCLRQLGFAPRRVEPEIICLCGSSRFIEHMAIFAWELEKQGAIVVSMHLLPLSYPGVAPDHQAEAEGIAEQMDELHLRKIDLADRVIVMNVNKYIGDSTYREILYTIRQHKRLEFLEEIPPEQMVALEEAAALADGAVASG